MKEDGFACLQCTKWRKKEELYELRDRHKASGICVYCHAEDVKRKADASREKAATKRATKAYKSGKKLPSWMYS